MCIRDRFRTESTYAMLRKLLAGLGLGAVAALIVLSLAGTTDLLDRQELTTYDWRMRLAADAAATDKNIVLVETNVWDDPNDKWSGRQSDRALADSAKKAGNVVMLADAVYEGIEGGGKDVNASTWPGSAYHAGPLAESRPM